MGKSNELTKDQYYEMFFRVRNSFNNVTCVQYDDVLHTNDQVLRNTVLYLNKLTRSKSNSSWYNRVDYKFTGLFPETSVHSNYVQLLLVLLQKKTPAIYTTSSVSTFSHSLGYILFVILLTSIILYKFIPINKLFNGLIRMKNIIIRNMDKKAEDSLYRNSEYATASPEQRKFNLIYHSS
ncbi:PIR Superfamily Protein [Plasmodium ovale curtisi]|uniref:PIR Superfamily Protein n=1 Tax=Plasmodium ovale curtisi TaxID=864141 RepID=A0A1A8X5Q3_PLAOA|nr:PIR Superfamily Protein [Plasmodium ovale curtisi]SBS99935.1 PIR Superfamily Protein [Plasmodium ovale curtisi]